MYMIMFEKYKTLIVGSIVVILAAIIFYAQPNSQTLIDNQSALSMSSQQLETTFMSESNEEESQDGPEMIFVDLKGAVKNPGIYRAYEGERVFDIIERSGGLLDTADDRQVNFAEKVVDEMIIYIPQIGEETDFKFVNDGTGNQNIKVNLNKADANELQTLPGIGPAKAETIIEYRDQHGPFQKIEDLMNVSGFGSKTFEKLKEHISVK